MDSVFYALNYQNMEAISEITPPEAQYILYLGLFTDTSV